MSRAVTQARTASFKIVDRAPTLKEYSALIKAVGWDRYTNLQAIPQALEHSLFCVVAIQRNKVIGTGRLVGDGARCIYLQDLMVFPKCQKRGVGSAIMDRLLEYINEKAPPKTYIHLFTQKDTAPFYARYGFKGPENSFYGMSTKKLGKSRLKNSA